MSERCKTCRHWFADGDRELSEDTRREEAISGQCRRMPPAVLAYSDRPEMRPETRFPETGHKVFCGEWEGLRK